MAGDAIHPGGKIVVAGSAQRHGSGRLRFAVARFNADGTLDSGFAGDGIATASFRRKFRAWANAVALQRCGKLVLAGTARIGRLSVAIARLDFDGALDRSSADRGLSTGLALLQTARCALRRPGGAVGA
jgi:uncharacterized delta-60 repeat protein